MKKTDDLPGPDPAASPADGRQSGQPLCQVPDLSRLRLSQDFGATVGVKKALLTVPVRKPHRQAFIRVRAEEEWRLQTAVVQLKEERETYLVDRPLWEDLAGEITPMVLFTTIDRQGVLTLWPIRLPGVDGRLDEWSRSAIDAAEMATTRWISVRANMALGAYEVYEAQAKFPDPEWPDVTFKKLIEIAFRDRFIQTADHPVIRKLSGQA
jgi:hypothetical protein